MASLLDTIRQNAQKPPEQQGLTDQTALAQKLFQAKSGRAVGPSDAATSNIGEQAAVADTNAQLGQVAQSGQVLGQQLGQEDAAQQQAATQARTELGAQNKVNQIQARLQSNQILAELEANKGQLDLEKDKSKLEQLGFNLALQDKQYVANLQREGERARLNDALSFSNEMAKSTMGGNEALLKNMLGNKNIMETSDRDYKRALSQISLKDALDMAKMQDRAAATQALYTGAGGVISGGIGAYGSYADKQSTTKPTTSKPGVSDPSTNVGSTERNTRNR